MFVFEFVIWPLLLISYIFILCFPVGLIIFVIEFDFLGFM